ncbi:MAG: IPT/TIG domain-containing protein [Deltaproteobacteria bacterium]|nr:IPT/TIG domain-containing protein [Deltaproteobacteria bacterium]
MRFRILLSCIGLIVGLASIMLACGHSFDEPSIDSVTPSRGQPGSPVTILGENLLDIYSQTTIEIAGTEINSREFFDIEDERIRFRIPDDVFSGDLRVEVGDKGSNAVPFEVVGSWLYVLHQSSTGMTALDTHVQRVEETFELPAVPTNIVFSYDGRHAYAIHANDNTISVIRSFDNSIITTIPVALKPLTGASIPDLDNPYVVILHEESDSVTIIDTERNDRATEIPLECPATSIAVTSDGEQAFVACREERMLYNIDMDDLEISEATPLEFRPGKMEVGPGDEGLFILNDADNALTVVDLPDIEDQDTITFEIQPVDFAVSLSFGRAIVIHQDNTASIVRLGGPELLETLEVGIEPVAVALEPFERYAFVANRQSRNLSVIDVGERTNIMTIDLEASPLALKVMETALGNWLYIINEQAPWLSVVSLGQYDVDEDEEPNPAFFSFLNSVDIDANPIGIEVQEIHRRPAAEEGFPESGIP